MSIYARRFCWACGTRLSGYLPDGVEATDHDGNPVRVHKTCAETMGKNRPATAAPKQAPTMAQQFGGDEA